MATPLGMESAGKLAPPRMPCAHVWECEPANGPTSKSKCRLCGSEKDFANSIKDDEPGDRRRIRLPGTPAKPKPEPAKGEVEMAKGVDTHQRRRQLTEAREEAMAMFREGKRLCQVRDSLREEWGEISSSTLDYWRKSSVGKESTGVRTATLKASGRDAQNTLTAPPKSADPDFARVGDLLVGVGLVMIGAWLKRTDGHGR